MYLRRRTAACPTLRPSALHALINLHSKPRSVLFWGQATSALLFRHARFRRFRLHIRTESYKWSTACRLFQTSALNKPYPVLRICRRVCISEWWLRQNCWFRKLSDRTRRPQQPILSRTSERYRKRKKWDYLSWGIDSRCMLRACKEGRDKWSAFPRFDRWYKHI